jgi:hypothetical protein
MIHEIKNCIFPIGQAASNRIQVVRRTDKQRGGINKWEVVLKTMIQEFSAEEEC